MNKEQIELYRRIAKEQIDRWSDNEVRMYAEQELVGTMIEVPELAEAFEILNNSGQRKNKWDMQ